MQLLDEDNLAKFIKSVVIGMKPELKSNLDQKDIKKMIELSSREWLNVGLPRSKHHDVQSMAQKVQDSFLHNRRNYEVEQIRFRCLLETQGR